MFWGTWLAYYPCSGPPELDPASDEPTFALPAEPPERLAELALRHRPREEVALGHLAPQSDERVALLLRLHALGADGHVERRPQAHHPLHDLLVDPVPKIGDERVVHLQQRDR